MSAFKDSSLFNPTQSVGLKGMELTNRAMLFSKILETTTNKIQKSYDQVADYLKSEKSKFDD